MSFGFRYAARLGDALAARGLKPGLEAPSAGERLRLALVCDEFTGLGIEPECDAVFLDPIEWRQQLRAHRPHLLLVESCWQGRRGEWRGLVPRGGEMVSRLVRFCRIAGVPTVFWAKEDPVHFDDFLETARCFDWVFTTDVDSAPRYRAALGHDRVAVMTFPVQPRLHHPLRTGERCAGAMFAGAWYGNFARRCGWFSELADGLMEAGPLHIYRRPAPSDLGDYPGRYSDALRPAVEYSDMGDLYRAYQVGLTINTVVSSPTMFARRAVELLACGTRVVSNPCQALAELFPNDVEQFADGASIRDAVARLYARGNDLDAQLARVSGVRTTMSQHTWHHRIEMIRAKVLGAAPESLEMIVLATVDGAREMERLMQFLESQAGVKARALVTAPPGVAGRSGIRVLTEGDPRSWAEELEDGDAIVAFWNPLDWYGPHYLQDLALAVRHYGGAAVGKASWYRLDRGGLELAGAVQPYGPCAPVPLRRAVVRASLLPPRVVDAIALGAGGGAVNCAHVSLDSFSYVEGGFGARLPEFMEAQ